MDKTMLTKLVLDATSYKQGMEMAKQLTSQVNKEMELWKLQNKAVDGSVKTLNQQIKSYKSTQSIVNNEIAITRKKLEEVAAAQGTTSKATVTYQNKLLDLQIQQEKLNKAMEDAAKQKIVAVGTAFQKVGNQMSSIGKTMMAAITAPILAAIGAGVKFSAAMEQTTINFETMLGSAEAAQSMVANLKKFADSTPFEMQGLADAAQQLLAFGVSSEKIMPSIKMLGDVSMGNKEKFNSLTLAFAQIQSTGRLMGQDLLQLVNAGFNPLKIISEKTGISMKDLKKKMEEGAISADMVNEAFKTATSEGGIFYKAMDRGATTFNGQLSTLADTAKSTLGDIIQPIFNKLSKNILPEVIAQVKNLQQWFANLSPETKNIISNVALLVAAIGPLIFIFGKTVSGIGGIITMFKNFDKATLVTNIKIALIVAAVVALAAAAYVIVKNWDKVVPFFKSLWEIVKSSFDTGVGGVIVALRAMQYGLAVAFGFVVDTLTVNVRAILGLFAKIPYVGSVFQTALDGVNKFRDGIGNFVESSKKQLDEAKANLKDASNSTADAFKTMTQAASELGTGMGNTIQESVDKVKGMFKSVPQAAEAIVPKAGQAGEDTGNAYADGIKLGGEEAAKAAKEAAEKAQQEMISNINSLNSAVLAALRRRYDAQKKLDENMLDAESKNLEKWKTTQLKYINDIHDKTVAALDKETEEKVGAIQAQIDAIDAQKEAEDEARQDKEELDSIASLRAKLKTASDADEMISIQNDLNETIESRTRRLHENELEVLKESLRSQIEAIQESAESKKDQLDAELKAQEENLTTQYDNEKENLEKRKTNIDQFYADVESSASLAAEAQKIIMSQNQTEIATLLKTYGNEYEDSGKTLGERFFEGFKSWADQIAELISNASTGTTTSKSKGAKGYAATSNTAVNSLLSQMEANSEAWHTATAQEKLRLQKANQDLASQIASKTGAAPVFNSSSGKWDVLQYANGTDSASPGWAWTGEKGPELIKFNGGESVIPNDKISGNNVSIVITGNTIASDMDINKIGDKLVSYLKLRGIKLSVPY
jgi:tape measure domain-containing protein